MASVYVQLYDQRIVKPIWILHLVLAVLYFVYGNWDIGCFLMIMWFLLMLVSKALKAEPPKIELPQDKAPSSTDAVIVPHGLNHADSFMITRANFRITRLLGLTVTVLAWHFGFQWYIAVILGIISMFLSKAMFLVYATALFRKKLREIMSTAEAPKTE